MALNKKAMQIIFTLWRIEAAGRRYDPRRFWGESPVKITRKRIRNRTRGLGRKGRPEKHELGKVWLEAVSDIPSLRTCETPKLHSRLNDHAF